jgi:hypothetical protein
MTGKSRTAEKFKSKGANILKGQQAGPNSMEDFLKDTQKRKSTIPQTHESTNPQNHNSTNKHFHQTTNYQIHRNSIDRKEELGRLHIQIRRELIEKLLDTVFKRKRDRKVKNRNATQRAIIEEALEKYFMQESVQSEAN